VWRKQADGAGYDFNTRIIFKAGDKTIKFKTEQEIIDALDDFIEREGMTDTSEIYIVKEMPKRECVVWQRSKGLF
jgi:hypothetical protein